MHLELHGAYAAHAGVEHLELYLDWPLGQAGKSGLMRSVLHAAHAAHAAVLAWASPGVAQQEGLAHVAQVMLLYLCPMSILT